MEKMKIKAAYEWENQSSVEKKVKDPRIVVTDGDDKELARFDK